jgi:hypothetical protein
MYPGGRALPLNYGVRFNSNAHCSKSIPDIQGDIMTWIKTIEYDDAAG